jgi:hypothetical protein
MTPRQQAIYQMLLRYDIDYLKMKLDELEQQPWDLMTEGMLDLRFVTERVIVDYEACGFDVFARES